MDEDTEQLSKEDIKHLIDMLYDLECYYNNPAYYDGTPRETASAAEARLYGLRGKLEYMLEGDEEG